MKKFLLSLMLLLALFSFLSPPVSADTFTCLACHSCMKGKIKTEKGSIIEVNIDEERFSISVHGTLGCTTCHKAFMDNPHESPKGEVSKELVEIASLISPKAGVDPIAYAACSECHSDIYKEVLGSVHGKNIVEKKQKDGAFCLDCHGSAHYIMPTTSKESMVNRWNAVETCGKCHYNDEMMKKYGLGSYIIETYKESFHGRKYRLGHPDAPECVSCHGSHNIQKWDDPSSPVSWQRRVETCGKCHPGATKKFVTAVTHKPAGKDNPIPYYGEKLLIVLTISVFIFIISHVTLSAYADIRDRFLKKGKEKPHD